MDATTALARLGGIGTAKDIAALSSRRGLRKAVVSGGVLRLSKDRYVLPTAKAGAKAAARVHGVVSHLNAAQHHGWEIAHQPEQPHVTIRPNRSVDAERVAGVALHRGSPTAGTGPRARPPGPGVRRRARRQPVRVGAPCDRHRGGP